jgi:hypothetical protein
MRLSLLIGLTLLVSAAALGDDKLIPQDTARTEQRYRDRSYRGRRRDATMVSPSVCNDEVRRNGRPGSKRFIGPSRRRNCPEGPWEGSERGDSEGGRP